MAIAGEERSFDLPRTRRCRGLHSNPHGLGARELPRRLRSLVPISALLLSGKGASGGYFRKGLSKNLSVLRNGSQITFQSECKTVVKAPSNSVLKVVCIFVTFETKTNVSDVGKTHRTSPRGSLSPIGCIKRVQHQAHCCGAGGGASARSPGPGPNPLPSKAARADWGSD